MATQGEYLVPRSHTPVWEEEYHETFAARLDKAFRRYHFIQNLRRHKYREAAEESPDGHTPPEVKERYSAEQRALEELLDRLADENSDADEGDREAGDDATLDGKARVEEVQSATEQPSLTRSQEAHGLPTPSLSPPTPLGRQRRCDDEEKKEEAEPEETEEEHARKAQVISAMRLDVPEAEKPDGSQVKGRKRRRVDDADEEWKGEVEREGKGERDMERPVKACKTTLASSPQQMRRPPERVKAG